MSRASLFVGKQEPTHRRAAFEFWTQNKVLSSGRACIFPFPSPPVSTPLYRLIYLFSFPLLLPTFGLSDLSRLRRARARGQAPGSRRQPAPALVCLQHVGAASPSSPEQGESSLFSKSRVMCPSTGAVHRRAV